MREGHCNRQRQLTSSRFYAFVHSHDEEPFLVCQASLVTEQGDPADLIAPVQPPHSSSTLSSSSQRNRSDDSEQRGRTSSRMSRSVSASSSVTFPTLVPSSPATVPSTGVRMLYGSLVASPQRFRRPAEEGTSYATYFIFPELCIRSRGRYKIRASLIRLPK